MNNPGRKRNEVNFREGRRRRRRRRRREEKGAERRSNAGTGTGQKEQVQVQVQVQVPRQESSRSSSIAVEVEGARPNRDWSARGRRPGLGWGHWLLLPRPGQSQSVGVGGTVARMDRRLRRGRGKGALRSGRERLLGTSSLGQRSGQCGPRYRASST
ncbi:hypothetical protein CKAH01_08934 [Colletotrichum kahawae]|uniref:Uncharacterized protein n=1 Tax=Colletotrichum kahawae TaxID=34407 RepID=A0AAD9Y179_COLKA|nr:hypothetical protein CKAH01_08934 [Colletotrichum kahawae]